MHRPRSTNRRRALRWASVWVVALALAACEPTGGATSSAQAHALVESGATLLDVRSDSEWASGHLEGATHIPIDVLASRIDELPRDRPVVVYCLSGGRSAAAARQLKAAGFEVHDLGAMANY